MLVYVLFQCVYCMFSAMAVLSPPPRRWVCLFSHRELLYLCVLFFIFLYGYLLHYVVYNTVVCINTIIYFSMEKKDSKANNYTPGKMRLQHTEVCFSNKQNDVFLWEKKKLAPCKPENWNLWPLCIHSHVSLVFFPLSNMKLLNFWKLIVCLIAWVCAVLLKDYP